MSRHAGSTLSNGTCSGPLAPLLADGDQEEDPCAKPFGGFFVETERSLFESMSRMPAARIGKRDGPGIVERRVIESCASRGEAGHDATGGFAAWCIRPLSRYRRGGWKPELEVIVK